MADFIDFVFRSLGLNRSQVARQAGDAGGLLGQLEQMLSVPFAAFYVLLIIVGIAFCLFGRQLFWATVFIGGAVTGMLLGLLVDAVQGGQGVATVLFALIGGVLAVLLQHVLNFVIGGLIGGVLLFMAIPHWVAFLLGFVLGGIAAINIFRYFVVVVTAFKGATMVGSSVKALMEPVPALQPLRDIRDLFLTVQHLLNTGQFPTASGSGSVLGLQPASWGLIITVLCFVLGVWFQLRRPARRGGAAGAGVMAGLLDDDLDLDLGIEATPDALGDMLADAATPSPPARARAAIPATAPPPVPGDRRPVPGGPVLPPAPSARAAPRPPPYHPAAARVAELPSVPRITTSGAEPPPLPGTRHTGPQAAALPSPTAAAPPAQATRAETPHWRASAAAPAMRPPPSRPEDARAVPAAPSAVASPATGPGPIAAVLVLLGLLALGGFVLWEMDRQSEPPAAPAAAAAPRQSEPRSQTAGWARNLAPASALPLPAGNCALIIASRQTLGEARQVLRVHGIGETGAIYRAQNGWYAVAAGLLPESRARDRIVAKTQARVIPRDSLCSSGRGYLARVWP